MSLTYDIAAAILEGFDAHYSTFREISRGAKDRYERADWSTGPQANADRIKSYDERVKNACEVIEKRFPTAGSTESLWPQIKRDFVRILHDHKQPECAETFYNSVACGVLHRRYYRNEYIFWRPAISTEYLEGDSPTYRCYYPGGADLTDTFHEIFNSLGLANPFQDLGRDIRWILSAIDEHFGAAWARMPNFQIHVLSSLFYRNKAAYVVGRVQNGGSTFPFVIPILQDNKQALFIDAVLLDQKNIGRVFSLARAYFMVDMEVPAAYVTFMRTVIPSKARAEIYTMLGLQKQGKTLFYRDMQLHLRHSTDQFVLAPGVKGMVMAVFTLPSFPYVFKIIRDWFLPPKDTDRESVRERYLFVKYHDRVGRMADTLEYSNVGFPRERFDKTLLAELAQVAPSCVEIDGDQVVIKHMYIERRMIPLDMYVRAADESKLKQVIEEFGTTVKDLASANIFPGDLPLKNFGVTRYGKVVFYDYDEICDLTVCNFREVPTPSSYDDEMSNEPSYFVGPRDVFPEQFPMFLFPAGKPRELFAELHPDLMDVRYWRGKQERIRAGRTEDVFPYPQDIRFVSRFRGKE
jgi:isocitrate dehydrogenase kinase/phosphatase